MGSHRKLVGSDLVAIELNNQIYNVTMDNIISLFKDIDFINYDDYIPHIENLEYYKTLGIIPRHKLYLSGLWDQRPTSLKQISEFRMILASNSAINIFTNNDLLPYSIGSIVDITGVPALGYFERRGEFVRDKLVIVADSKFNCDYIFYDGSVSDTSKGLDFNLWSILGEGRPLYCIVDSYIINENGRITFNLVYSKKADPFSCMGDFLYCNIDPNLETLGNELDLDTSIREGAKVVKTSFGGRINTTEVSNIGIVDVAFNQGFLKKDKTYKVDVTENEKSAGILKIPNPIGVYTQNNLGLSSSSINPLNLADDTSKVDNILVQFKERVYESEAGVIVDEDITKEEISALDHGFIIHDPLFKGSIYEDEFNRGVLVSPMAEWGEFEGKPELLFDEDFCALYKDRTGLDLIFQAKNGIGKDDLPVGLGALLFGFYLGEEDGVHRWHHNGGVNWIRLFGMDSSVGETFCRENDGFSFFEMCHNQGGYNFENTGISNDPEDALLPEEYKNYIFKIIDNKDYIGIRDFDFPDTLIYWPWIFEKYSDKFLFSPDSFMQRIDVTLESNIFKPVLKLQMGQQLEGQLTDKLYTYQYSEYPSYNTHTTDKMYLAFKSDICYNQNTGSTLMEDQDLWSHFTAGIKSNHYLITYKKV